MATNDIARGMKTTVEISDNLLEEVRKLALREKKTIRALVEEGLRRVLAESESYWPELRQTLTAGLAAGPQVHDGRVAALCRLHGVRELWTADRDYGRYPGVKTLNPLVGQD